MNKSEMTKTLILGAARSGKTHFAQNRAIACERPVHLIVTAHAGDEEMALRIEKHQNSRPAHWQVIEAPFELPQAIEQTCQPEHCVIVDCLTLWLSNCLCQRPESVSAYGDELIDAVNNAKGMLLLVSNEVGWSIVPDNALARAFCDEAGRLHQRLAQVCDQVQLVVAGLPLSLKP